MDRMREHLEGGFPNEACGALLGRVDGGDHQVVEFRAMRNTVEDRPWDRYALDPLEQLRVQKDAEARGLEIIGFAHSHPNHPSIPSRFDAEHAWTFYSYVVASVLDGKLGEARSWRLDDGQRFREEPFVIA
ncbi:MAG: M67 family metallopeptidase [Chloroflexi bacterium]|nr:MAG: M67 family metallopeptidase [Chloroflexota bacterium]